MGNLHGGHREKMRERFEKNDLDDFQPHEVLEMLLFFSIPRGNTNEIAHMLINRFGSLSAVMDAPYEDLVKVEGVGAKSANLIKFMPHFTRRYMEDYSAKVKVLSSHKEIGDYLVSKFIGRSYECIHMLCMDGKGKILYSDIIAKSKVVNSCTLNVRTVVEIAIRCNAVAVVMAHNHPTGFAVPSPDDIQSTRSIKEHLDKLDIAFLDHVIVSGNEYMSMFSWGMLGN